MLLKYNRDRANIRFADSFELINLLSIQNIANFLLISAEHINRTNSGKIYFTTISGFVTGYNNNKNIIIMVEVNKNVESYINEVSMILKNKEDLIKLLTPEEQEIELEETYLTLDNQISIIILNTNF